MPWPSLLTLFDFSGFWPNSNQDSFGRNHRASLESILTGAGQQSHLPLVVWRPWSPVPALWLPLLSRPGTHCTVQNQWSLQRPAKLRRILGFLWAFCFAWLCGVCASRAHPGSLAGCRGRLAPGCRLSLLALLPCSTFCASSPLLFLPPSLSFFFPHSFNMVFLKSFLINQI